MGCTICKCENNQQCNESNVDDADLNISKYNNLSVEPFDLHVVDAKSQFRSHIKDPNQLLWKSDCTKTFNDVYGTALNKVANNTSYHLNITTLKELQAKTMVNMKILVSHLSIWTDRTIDKNAFKRDRLSKLPTATILFPIFDKLKPLRYAEYLTLTNFPDNNPTAHWCDILEFISNYNYKLIQQNEKERIEIGNLFKQQLSKAEITDNYEAIGCLKELAENIFGHRFMKDHIKRHKLSKHRKDMLNIGYSKLKKKETAQIEALEKHDKKLKKYKQKLEQLLNDEY
eukprot:340364_1